MRNRPLSPHLQVYKPQWTSILSILHRATGVLLFLGLIPLTFWLYVTSIGGTCHECTISFFKGFIGRVMLMGWSFCLFYHLCNGIRHLVWDAGRGYELKTAFVSGMLVVFASLMLTLLCWGYLLS